MQVFHGSSWKHRVLKFSFIGVLGDFWDISLFIQNGMPSLNFIKQHGKQIICIPF